MDHADSARVLELLLEHDRASQPDEGGGKTLTVTLTVTLTQTRTRTLTLTLTLTRGRPHAAARAQCPRLVANLPRRRRGPQRHGS